MSESEPFDPSPLSDQEQAHLHMCYAARHIRLAVDHLEGVDFELQRRILSVLQTAVELRNGMRS